MAKNIDLTKGNISKGLWAFAIPLMLGNVMQQFYNLADTWVVGRFIGNTALAAVGSSYTLMTFLTSIIIGLSLGSSTFISMAFGNKDNRTIRNGIVISSEITCGLTIILIIIYGIVIAYILSPVVRIFERRLKLSNGISIALTYAVFLGIIFVLCIYRIFCNVYLQLLFQPVKGSW